MAKVKGFYVHCGCSHHGDHLGCDKSCKRAGACGHKLGKEVSCSCHDWEAGDSCSVCGATLKEAVALGSVPHLATPPAEVEAISLELLFNYEYDSEYYNESYGEEELSFLKAVKVVSDELDDVGTGTWTYNTLVVEHLPSGTFWKHRFLYMPGSGDYTWGFGEPTAWQQVVPYKTVVTKYTEWE